MRTPSGMLFLFSKASDHDYVDGTLLGYMPSLSVFGYTYSEWYHIARGLRVQPWKVQPNRRL